MHTFTHATVRILVGSVQMEKDPLGSSKELYGTGSKETTGRKEERGLPENYNTFLSDV